MSTVDKCTGTKSILTFQKGKDKRVLSMKRNKGFYLQCVFVALSILANHRQRVGAMANQRCLSQSAVNTPVCPARVVCSYNQQIIHSVEIRNEFCCIDRVSVHLSSELFQMVQSDLVCTQLHVVVVNNIFQHSQTICIPCYCYCPCHRLCHHIISCIQHIYHSTEQLLGPE